MDFKAFDGTVDRRHPAHPNASEFHARDLDVDFVPAIAELLEFVLHRDKSSRLVTLVSMIGRRSILFDP